MDASFLLAVGGFIFALPVFVIGMFLGMRRRTRYFLWAVGAGLAAGFIGALFIDTWYPARTVFLAGFSIVALPLEILFGLIAAIDHCERRKARTHVA